MENLPREFVVDRRTWSRGGTGCFLLNNDGTMCCLGFVCTQSGVPSDKIVGRGMPNGVCDPMIRQKITFLLGETWVDRAAFVNDAPEISDAEREQTLIELFGQHGIILRFEN